MSEQLERAIARFRPNGRASASNGGTAQRISAAAFRAAVEQRLLSLERDIGEMKGRLNGLIFVVVGAVITQLVLKVAQG
jgi:hypothetical protein